MIEVSFCSTCGNRRKFAEETLPKNAKLVEQWNAEIVVVDYGSTDGLADFIRAFNHPHVKYLRHEATEFHSAHSKNLAHRHSSGRVVVNLDIDNFLLPESFEEYRQLLNRTVMQGRVDRELREVIGRQMQMHMSSGSFGRIAMTRWTFDKLGGYDERFKRMGFQDEDLIHRAHARGMKIVYSQTPSPCIPHPKDCGWFEMDARNRALGVNPLRRVNPNGWGLGEVKGLDGCVI